MIVIGRGLCRGFPALARKCVSGRPRGPAPHVVVETKAGTLSAWAKTADAVLVYAAPARGGDGVLVVPVAVLEAAGPGDGPVELTVGPDLRGEVRWADGGAAAVPFDAVLPGRQHGPPDPPADWHPVPVEFLAALHACGRSTARDAGRYALTRVQVKGKAGRVVGTDGHTALVWGGFDLPFAADVLVPAVPVFGAKELAAAGEVRVGRTAAHLVVGAGPWRVFLPVDTTGRFPDVAGVVPKHAPSVAGFDGADAARLRDALPGLPGGDDEHRPVTLALDRGLAVLARDAATGRVEAVRLEASPATGPPARVAVDRRVLARALALGCHTVRVDGKKPVVFEGTDKLLVTAALDPALAVGGGADATHPDATKIATDTNPATERRTAVRHETTGHDPGGRDDPPDPLAAAEEVRAALADALGKAGRLVTALKSRRKEQRALKEVWSSLKALHLGPGGAP